jgi:hypothetical protein
MNQPKEETLEIRLDSLETACQNHPQQMFKWGVELAKAKKKTKVAKNDLKLCHARISRQVRFKPGDYALEKITDASVEAAVLDQQEYQDCQQRLIDVEYEEDVLKAFMDAMSDGREELGNLTKLHGQMYFSKPDTKLPEADRVKTMRDGVQPRKKKGMRDDD